MEDIFCDPVTMDLRVVTVVKNPPANARDATSVKSLGREVSLGEGMATDSSILAWRIPMDRGAWGDTVHRVTQSQTQLKRLRTHAHTRLNEGFLGVVQK